MRFLLRLGRTPRRDLACGLLFGAVAVVGLIEVTTNARLMDTFGRGPDPGPALLPLIVLSLLLTGGAVLLLKGLAGWTFTPPEADEKDAVEKDPTETPPPSQHLHAIALLASLAVLPVMISWLGFLLASTLFAAPWLIWLEYRRGVSRRRALLLGVVVAALLAIALHVVFVTLLGIAI
ncbi:tripartite tricarboxylate transporter TctB family protein [Vreelandella malpeensis]|uniref:Tripartite tricarboxylate transporter TctB family protein n=1 Tax=Vreelandella malpeensis TaxID=1172368 RepID=A0ABS8DS91_9GAMM|nr:tripartite tricarboxylate transporter TctB family protein [Halomonas malpeensis]MCB8889182.1 tripartite tricarboxylate transporter TctB family protein [Halomonas malpeensis]